RRRWPASSAIHPHPTTIAVSSSRPVGASGHRPVSSSTHEIMAATSRVLKNARSARLPSTKDLRRGAGGDGDAGGGGAAGADADADDAGAARPEGSSDPAHQSARRCGTGPTLPSLCWDVQYPGAPLDPAGGAPQELPVDRVLQRAQRATVL